MPFTIFLNPEMFTNSIKKRHAPQLVDRLSCRQHVSRVVSRIASERIQKLLTPGMCEAQTNGGRCVL